MARYAKAKGDLHSRSITKHTHIHTDLRLVESPALPYIPSACVYVRAWMRSQRCPCSIRLHTAAGRFPHGTAGGWYKCCLLGPQRRTAQGHMHLVLGAAVRRLLAGGAAQLLEWRIDAEGVVVKSLHGMLTSFRRRLRGQTVFSTCIPCAIWQITCPCSSPFGWYRKL